MPLDALAHALLPVAKRLHYRPLPAHKATRLITDTLTDTLVSASCDVIAEPRTHRGRLDLLAHAPNGRSLAIEIDRSNKAWSVRKLAGCAEEFWTDALWVRWLGPVTLDVPDTVCVIDMTRARVRVRNAGSVSATVERRPQPALEPLVVG
ncbi:MAG: hypothetical protein AAGH64_01795 [Planctomycetota bacterium]